MSINLSALMKQRYDTAANWTAQNPTLLAGEIGIESDTKRWKIGSGSTAWTSLTYANGSTYPFVNADIAAGAEIAVSKLADGSARQLLQTDAAGTGVEWTSDVSIPGALSVTGNVNIDSNTLYVDAVNNRVGILTPGPQAPLHVVGEITSGAAGTNGSISLRRTSDGVTVNSIAYVSATDEMRLNNGSGTGIITFQTVSTTRASIDSSGRLLVGAAANANGGILQLSSGITFPATAVAASDANTLDDYEEGTWTGTDASGAGLSIAFVGGRYTKVGRLVYVSAETITYPVTASTASATLGGLPFTNGPQNAGVAALITTNVNANRALVVASTTTAFFYPTSSAANSTNAQLSNTIIYAFAATYQV